MFVPMNTCVVDLMPLDQELLAIALIFFALSYAIGNWLFQCVMDR